MSAHSASIDLTHHFLIAMPGLQDSFFGRSVVYVCEHTPQGALGLVVNKASDMPLERLFESVDLKLGRADLMGRPVLVGGPVQTERGFVLHEPLGHPLPKAAAQAAAQTGSQTAAQTPPADAAAPDAPETIAETPEESCRSTPYASTMAVPGGLHMTTSRDVLEALALGAGPQKVQVMLGFSAWGEGQLESEIGENSWLTVAADPAVVFDTPLAQRYDRALQLLGLQPWMLGSHAGHA